MEQIGQRQQVGTAAGRKIFRDEAVIQRRQRVPVRVGRLGQKGLQLLGEGLLTRPAGSPASTCPRTPVMPYSA